MWKSELLSYILLILYVFYQKHLAPKMGAVHSLYTDPFVKWDVMVVCLVACLVILGLHETSDAYRKETKKPLWIKSSQPRYSSSALASWCRDQVLRIKYPSLLILSNHRLHKVIKLAPASLLGHFNTSSCMKGPILRRTRKQSLCLFRQTMKWPSTWSELKSQALIFKNSRRVTLTTSGEGV